MQKMAGAAEPLSVAMRNRLWPNLGANLDRAAVKLAAEVLALRLKIELSRAAMSSCGTP
jgi:hypothetical protein